MRNQKGVSGGTFVAHLAFIVCIAIGAVLLAGGCNWTRIENNNQQAQGITGASNPSPSPGAPCELISLDAGTAGDVTEISQGSTVVIGVSLIGAQGLELPASCLSQFQPQWAGGAPCLLGSTGFAASLQAPASTPLGSVCSATVEVAGKTDSVQLVVVN